jgi:CRISPR-associated protein Cas2
MRNYILNVLPSKGVIGIITITNKQFGMMELFHRKAEKPLSNTPQQLELF